MSCLSTKTELPRTSRSYALKVRLPVVSSPRQLIIRTPRVDVLLTGLFLVVAVASAVARKPPEGPIALTVPVAFVTASSLLWRTTVPLLAIALAMGAELTQTAFGHTPSSLWSFAIALILMYSVAARLPEGPAATGGATIVIVECIGERVGDGVDYLFIAIVFGGAWLIGRATREWQGRATHAEEHQHELARLAVAEERVRIARELHDVVAHGLSVIAVQADAAEAVLSRDATLAGPPLRAIRSNARESLGEMRQLLNLLRSDDNDPAVLAPVRGFADLDALVSAMRDAGLPVDSTLTLGAEPVGAGLELATYRIVQESLTNVLKHAGRVSTRVEVVVLDDAVRICVLNAAGTSTEPPAPGGRGQLGMRERAHAADGSLSCETSTDGGYRVEARLPRQDGRS